jgi:hypothetical protein
MIIVSVVFEAGTSKECFNATCNSVQLPVPKYVPGELRNDEAKKAKES